MNEVCKQISSAVGEYTPEQVMIVQNSVAKGTTPDELAYFLSVCSTIGLNPFRKEVWCYKDNKKNLLIFAGRDGFLSKAQENPSFAGIRSCEVKQNDHFKIDVANNKIEHSVSFGDRGPIVGAYAIVFRKDGEPTIELAEFATYNKGYNTWKTHPEEMIKKVAECHALKKAFGLSGVISEHDYDTSSGVAVPISVEVSKTPAQQVVEIIDGYTGEDLEDIKAQCQRDYKGGIIDEEYVKDLRERLQ